MGARWYDPYLARWLSADTIVPDPANPQSLNRYSYVTGNPLRLIDATGHCYGDPGDGKDDACWDAYFQATGILGSDFDFLGQWGLSDLRDLLSWMARDVRFEGDWTSVGLQSAVTGLQGFLDTLSGDWDTMAAILGISGGSTFTYQVCAACREGGSSVAVIPNRLVIFDSNPSLEMFLHETGHHVDYYLAQHLQTPSFWWSETGLIGLGWTKQVHQSGEAGFYYLDDYKDRAYSGLSPVEDFADTFAAYTFLGSSQRLPSGWRSPSSRRQVALTTALGDVIK